jgi:glycosyltransferase involved in cell wall biosynthesis
MHDMRIAIYIDNSQLEDVNFSDPEAGNPGCGGTEFLLAVLPYYLRKYSKTLKVNIFARKCGRFPQGVKVFVVESVINAVERAREERCDIFVYRPVRDPQCALIEAISRIQMDTVVWFHVTPKIEHLKILGQAEYIKAMVCVEHEQFDGIQDICGNHKLSVIVNGFDCRDFNLAGEGGKIKNTVVYLGALVPQKGFHILAKAWKGILKRCPMARLIVIGSGDVYGRSSSWGPWGLTWDDYERRGIIPYLSNETGGIHPSVTFLGKVGVEKKSTLQGAVVGVVNPRGEGENCPGSALEFQASGTPVVAGAREGMLDTVLHGKTGLLCKGEEALIDGVCALLEEPSKALKMGERGRDYIISRYSYDSVVGQWVDLFAAIKGGPRLATIKSKKNYLYRMKMLRVANRYIRKFMPCSWPSILEVAGWGAFLRGRLKHLKPGRDSF